MVGTSYEVAPAVEGAVKRKQPTVDSANRGPWFNPLMSRQRPKPHRVRRAHSPESQAPRRASRPRGLTKPLAWALKNRFEGVPDKRMYDEWERHKCHIDYNKTVVVMAGRELTCVDWFGRPLVGGVQVVQRCTVPGHSSATVCCRVNSREIFDSGVVGGALGGIQLVDSLNRLDERGSSWSTA